MELLDLSLPTPAENLALDEALLLEAETSGSADRELLRFWESPVHFAVVGVAGKIDRELHREALERDGIPRMRRASGGGTVLQGPGCLNYSLILSLEDRPRLLDVTRGYRIILERVLEGLSLPGASLEGICDLAIDGVKFSGNAQKRKRRTLLHHGTLLHDFDLDLISRYLQEPERRPDYRADRTHEGFVRNLDLDAHELKRRIGRAWPAAPLRDPATVPPIRELVETKYLDSAWIEKF